MDADQSSYYPYYQTASAYKVRRGVLEAWLRMLFNDQQITVHESDDSQYSFRLVRPLTKEERKVIRRDLPNYTEL